MTEQQKALAWIDEQFEVGRTVYLTTHLKQWKCTPKNALKFKESGRPLFKIGRDGQLYMASGRSYLCILLGSVSLRAAP